MHEHLKQKPPQFTRKKGLLLVLFLLILIFTVKSQLTYFPNTFLLHNFNKAWLYTFTAIVLILILLTFYFLQRKIKNLNEIVDSLTMQKEHFRVVLDTVSEALITTGKKGEIHYMNPAAERLTGWTNVEAKELQLEEVYNVVSEESGKSFENIVSRILKTGETIGYENHTLLLPKNKNKLVISNSGSPLFDNEGKVTGTVLAFNDITEQKKIEDRLKKSLNLNKGMLNSLSSRIIVIDASGIIIKVNKPWNVFVQDKDSITLENFGKGANYFDIWKGECNTTEDVPQKAMAGIDKVLNGTINEFYLEYPCYSLNTETWFCMVVTKFISAESLVVIEHYNINERKKEERRTKKAIERYDILARATSDTIWDWDIKSNKMLYNASITKMFGYSIAEVENVVDWWKRNIHPDDLDIVSMSLTELFEKGSETVQLEYRFCCADKSYKYIFDRAFVIYDENKRAVRMIGAMQDITYKKEDEKRIAKAIMDAQEKERCHIGLELHDNVNQILAGTQLTLGLAKDELIDRDKILQFIDISKGYIANAIDELRKLSHELVPASFDDNTLRSVFENLLLDINLNNQFDIYFHFDEVINDVVNEDIQINLYRILQEQVKNIVKYSSADKIEIKLTLKDDIVRMRTFDNGVGFDSKSVKKGIGLGNMKKRVDFFSGKFILNSAPGKGCEIIIEIETASNEIITS